MSCRLSTICGVLLALALVGCGGGKNSSLNRDGGTNGDGGSGPFITTTSLPDAFAGADYLASVSATGGQAPLTWSVTTSVPALTWLVVDPATGELSGRAGVVASGDVVLQVTDSAQQQASKTLTLNVLGCQDGETHPCVTAQTGACYVGSRSCQGGTFGTCAAADASTSPNQCGPGCSSCGTSGDTCLNGACSCGTGGAVCDGGSCCSGGCVDTNSDVHACGGCGIDCTTQRQPPNTDAGCANSQCSYACAPGYLNCDGANPTFSSPDDDGGCEIDAYTDVNHCGSCGNDCSKQLGSNAASAKCSTGQCQVASCTSSSYGDCNGNFSDGCETNLTNTTTHCGSCGNNCTQQLTNNATSATCSASVCKVSACTSPFQDCDGNFANGCEINLNTDVHNCGACGNDCTKQLGPNATGATCSSGVCQVTTCSGTYKDCNGSFSDGCETNIGNSDPNNCGACGTSCPTVSDPSGGGQYCSGSQCCTTICSCSTGCAGFGCSKTICQ